MRVLKKLQLTILLLLSLCVTEINATPLVNLAFGITPTTLEQSTEPQDVVLTFTNNNTIPFVFDGLADTHWPTGFTDIQDNCSGSTLQPAATCTISGKYTPSQPGTITWSTQVKSFGYGWKRLYSANLIVNGSTATVVVTTNITGNNLPPDFHAPITATDGTHTYGPLSQGEGSSAFANMVPGSYTVSAGSYQDPVTQHIYEPESVSNPYSIDAKHSVITINYVDSTLTVPVTTNITGINLPTGFRVDVSATNETNNYGPFSQIEGSSLFARMAPGSYTVSASNYQDPVTQHIYQAQLSNPYSIDATHNVITINYVDAGAATIPVTIKISGDITKDTQPQTVPIKLGGIAGQNSISADGAAHAWGNVAAGSYTVTPVQFESTTGNTYTLVNAGPFAISNTNEEIDLQYNVVPVTKDTVNTNISGLPSGATVTVSMSNGTHTYGPHTQGTNTQKFDDVLEGSYTVSASNYVGGDGKVYVPTLNNPYAINTDPTTINIAYSEVTSTKTLPGWPDYLAMGNITIGVTEFQTSDTNHSNLDAAFTYNTINGDASIGVLIGLPDPSLPGNGPGLGWYKDFYLMHDATLRKKLASNIIPVIIYYSDIAGSGAMAGFGNDGSTYVTTTPTGNNDHESPGNLTVQYANLFNFLGLLHYEAKAQPGVVAAIVYNPDLLGGMLQSGGGVHGNDQYWLSYSLGPNSIKNALQAAVDEVTLHQDSPTGPTVQVQLDPWIKTQLTANNNALINSIITQINAAGGDTGKGYINSLNIITKNLLTACGSDCNNIKFGWQLNAWLAHGNANNLEPAGAGVTEGTYAANWLGTTGLFAGNNEVDFIVFDKYEADGLSPSGLSNGEYWDTQMWGNFIDFAGTIAHTLGQGRAKLPAMLWQIPASHIPNVSEQGSFPIAPNRVDNNPNYFFGNTYGINLTTYSSDMNTIFNDLPHDAGINAKYNPSQTIGSYIGPVNNFTSSHLNDLMNANIVAILWGGGDYTRTTSGFCLLGENNCAPAYYNDDHGWMANLMGNYYQAGGAALPGLK